MGGFWGFCFRGECFEMRGAGKAVIRFSLLVTISIRKLGRFSFRLFFVLVDR